MRKENAKLTPLVHILLMATLFSVSPVWAKGNPKGILDRDEINFFKNTAYPILIKSKLCVSADKDCYGNQYFVCLSHDALACDAYGITDEKVIKEILTAVINSGLKVSTFKFWRSKYHETTFFEKPLLEFIDRTGEK
ncbi:hypothetical protein FGKAn22_07570 [Ferrigenium kumadai]|uniref:Uncharacterized protein n=1 Tax=Ferrigenium kumadai TaxID=1682490 RepID=A0AAN1VZ77_9PROT|nr:hypothetical protein [Ferrigenium kumadai]BBI99064.1 hypothetical protein FGKAn22_07570 [Ferrigenium kumadai]